MNPEQRFERAFFDLLGEIGEDGMTGCRAESIEAVEWGVKALGLAPLVADYLATTFEVQRLAELEDADLARAFRFIARLQGQAGRVRRFPLAPGTVVDGEVFWITGKVSLGD